MANPRKSDRRAFQPSLDGVLEPRLLLSKAKLSLPTYPQVIIQSGAGGMLSRVILPNGEPFEITTARGTVQAIANKKTGHIDIIIRGSTEDTEVAINPISRYIAKGVAHDFAYGDANRSGMMQVGNITVTSGTLGAFVGYNTAVLNGSLNIPSSNRVDRIAFQALAPGASITTGGDLEDLDIRQNANLVGQSSFIHVGRDLNWFNMPGDLNLTNGATLAIGRYVGETFQPNRGSGPAGQGIQIGGNLNIGPGSSFTVGNSLVGNVVINGLTTGASRISVANQGIGGFFFQGGFTP